MNQILAKAIKHWSYVAPLLKHPENEKELDALIARLDELLDIVGDNEKHPLMGLVDILSDLIFDYEKEHHKNLRGTGIDALKFLMQAHSLQQSDLPEIASQGVLSEILRGKRALNLRQIKLLAKRFHVEPSTFMGE
jgi:HTH-type transcriptional regulator/antitoxin HigA